MNKIIKIINNGILVGCEGCGGDEDRDTNIFLIPKDGKRTTKINTSIDIDLKEFFDNSEYINTFGINTTPTSGNASLNSNILTYTPNNNFVGTDIIKISARTVYNDAVAKITIEVLPAIIATDILVNVKKNENTEINVSELFASTIDSTLSLSISGSPNNGNASLDSNSNILTYTPDNNFVGEDEMEITATDTNSYEAKAKIKIKVNE